ncbi:MAG TPA: VanZ family protein, partial [Gemmatimonadaceae bacterium]
MPTRRLSPKVRMLGLSVGTLALVAILAATLTPSDVQLPPSGPWCLICGDHGTIDVLQNVILFLPIGAAAFWLGVPLPRAIAMALVLTVAIEVLQYNVIPGRDGSLSDVLTNTAGSALGFGLAASQLRFLRPSSQSARWQFGAALVSWVLLMTATVAAFQPHTPKGPYAVVTPPPPATAGASPVVTSVEINGEPLPIGQLRPLPQLARWLATSPSEVRMTVLVGTLPDSVERIARLTTSAQNIAAFELSQSAFSCFRRMWATTFRVRTPSFVLPGPFRNASGEPIEHRFACTRDDGSVALRHESEGKAAEASVRLTPGLGWALLIPTRLAPRAAIRWPNVLWLVALSLLVGFYGACSAPTRSSAPRRRLWAFIATATILLAIVATQLVLPNVASMTPSP